jgi:hypothetical protein
MIQYPAPTGLNSGVMEYWMPAFAGMTTLRTPPSSDNG